MSEFSSCATNSITGNGSMKAVADISEKVQKAKKKIRIFVFNMDRKSSVKVQVHLPQMEQKNP
jgi:alpha-L-arabinofuranosidase